MKVKTSLIFFASVLAISGCGDTPAEEPNKLVSISITHSPNIVDYVVGEHLDPTGLVITATGTKETALIAYQGNEEEFTFEPSLETALTKEETSVTVTYKTKTVSFTITITEQGEEDEYETYTINFATYDLGSSGVLQSGDSTFNSKIISLVNTEASILESVEVEKPKSNGVKIQKKDFAENYGSAQGLIVGGQDIDGKITFTFSKKLSYVTIKAQQYFNIQYSYDNVNNTKYLDPNYDGQEYMETEDGDWWFEGYFKLNVNDTLWKGPGEGIQYDEDWNILINIPEIAEKDFEINSTTLTLEGFKSERARIYEMVFTFEK